MTGKTAAKSMKKEVIKKTPIQIKVTGKTNKITIDFPEKGKAVIYLDDKYEILRATLNGKALSNPELYELIARHKLTSDTFQARALLPPCPWIYDNNTRAMKRVCLPGYVCPPGT